jgi:DNA-binding Xre family transcriptional regulator
MITLNLQRLCQLRGIETPFAFLRTHGFTHGQSHALANGSIKEIKLRSIEKLCRIFRCLPNELLDYTPDARGLDPSDDILAPLRKQPLDTKGLNSLMASLPPDEIIRITTELQARYQPPGPGPTEGQ